MATGNFPVPTPMVCTGDTYMNWQFFRQQYEDYEIATELNKKNDPIWIATLRSVMGKECLQIYQHLDIEEGHKKKVKESLDALEYLFKPTKNTVYERSLFNTCSQGPNESVEQYIARLRRLAANCEYKDLADELIQDRLILGTKDLAVRGRMFREPDLDLAKAIKMCRISECSNLQLRSSQRQHSRPQAKAHDQHKTTRKPC